MRRSRRRARGVRWGGGVPVREVERGGGCGGRRGGGGAGSRRGGAEVGDETAMDGGAVRGRAAVAMVDRVPAAAVSRTRRG